METELITRYATCETRGCGNEALPIRVDIPVPPVPDSVTCGVCSKPIADLTDTPHQPVTEIPTWLT